MLCIFYQSIVANPKAESFDLQIKGPIEFKIISVVKNNIINNGNFVSVKIQIMNNPSMSVIGQAREAVADYKWIDRASVIEIQSSGLPDIKENNLITAELDATLYWFHFGFNFPPRFDVNQPCEVDLSLLEELF